MPFIYDKYSDDDDEDMLEVISLCNLGTIQWGYVHQVFNESPNNVHLDMNNSQTYIDLNNLILFVEVPKRIIGVACVQWKSSLDTMDCEHVSKSGSTRHKPFLRTIVVKVDDFTWKEVIFNSSSINITLNHAGLYFCENGSQDLNVYGIMEQDSIH